MAPLSASFACLRQWLPNITLAICLVATGCTHGVARDPLGFPRAVDAATHSAILAGVDRFLIAWESGDEALFRQAVRGGGVAHAARWYPSIDSMDVVPSNLFDLRHNPNPVTEGHIATVYWNARTSLESEGLAVVRMSIATFINGERDHCKNGLLVMVKDEGSWRAVNYLTVYDQQALQRADFDEAGQCDALDYAESVRRPVIVDAKLKL